MDLDRQAATTLNTLLRSTGVSTFALVTLLLNSKRRAFLAGSSLSQKSPIETSWTCRRGKHQKSPETDWHTWLFLGGRGAGKTRAGAEWLTTRALPGAHLALVGPTLNDVREVMIEGPSGLRTMAAKAGGLRYYPSRRKLYWANGAAARVFSAEDPERLRGPQFDAAWGDEFCVWPRKEETLALLRMGLRRGTDPRLMLTTTPRPSAVLRRLMAEPGVETTRATAGDNAANLAPGFLEMLDSLYGGTRMAAQEIQGQVLDAPEGALWRAEDFARLRTPWPARFDRLVIGVDPPVSATGDACGIVAVGRTGETAVVLEDASARGLTPLGWARRVCEVAARLHAHQIVAEANQGGEMVRTVLNQAGAPCPVALVHATLGKRARAEPVAALYEQGRVGHAAAFPDLEEELMALGDETLAHSPDRADALVWALTALMLTERREPRVRVL